MFESSDSPDKPEEAEEGPGQTHVVEALSDCLTLAPSRLAAVHCLCAIAVILLPGRAYCVVGGDMKRGAQTGLSIVRDTNPEAEHDEILDRGR